MLWEPRGPGHGGHGLQSKGTWKNAHTTSPPPIRSWHRSPSQHLACAQHKHSPDLSSGAKSGFKGSKRFSVGKLSAYIHPTRSYTSATDTQTHLWKCTHTHTHETRTEVALPHRQANMLQAHTHSETHSCAGDMHKSYTATPTNTHSETHVRGDTLQCAQQPTHQIPILRNTHETQASMQCYTQECTLRDTGIYTEMHRKFTLPYTQGYTHRSTHICGDTHRGYKQVHTPVCKEVCNAIHTWAQRYTEKPGGCKHIPQVHAHSIAHACRHSHTPRHVQTAHTAAHAGTQTGLPSLSNGFRHPDRLPHQTHVCRSAATHLPGHRHTSNSYSPDCSTLASVYAYPHLL